MEHDSKINFQKYMIPDRPAPPKWAERFLEWYCDPRLLEDLQGDLHERFMLRTKSMSALRAKLLYIRDVFVFLKPYTFRRKNQVSSFLFMFRNYSYSSSRNLMRSKLHTGLIVFGLTISISGFILISMYVSDELKYDRHYDKAERIFQITTELQSETSNSHVVWTDAYLGHRLKELYPEVEEVVELLKLQGKITVQYKDKIFSEDLLYRAERTYFRIFSHSWIAGDPSTALTNPKSIVITQKIAKKYFGEELPLNKVLTVSHENFIVTGIIRDLPGHTDLKFDALLSTDNEYLAETNFWCLTFILFRDVKDANGFGQKLSEVAKKYMEPEAAKMGGNVAYQMESLPSVHFGKKKLFDTPKSSKSNIYVFSIIALFILLIACINYANLSIVQVAKRRTEAGVRKIMGALPSQLMKQYLFESFILSALSFILALGLTAFLMRFMNQLTEKELSLQELFTTSSLVIILFAILIIAFLAGSYPAILLSSTNPLHAFKGHLRIVSKSRIRNLLIVFQFTASITLMISSKIVFDQFSILTDTDPGFNKEQVLVVDVPKDTFLIKSLPLIQKEFSELAFVSGAALAGYNSIPTSDMNVDTYDVEYKGEYVAKAFNDISVDANYIKLLKIELKDGRELNQSEVETGNTSILVNESLVKMMEWENPLEQIIYENSNAFEIVGVVKDFHFNSLHKSIEPIIIHGNNNSPEKLMLKVDRVDFEKVVAMERVWNKYMDKTPFNFEFLDSYFNQQYKSEMTMRNLLWYFSGFTIVIACLGLFGLVAISTSIRIKEFAIRKVLGAGFLNIVFPIVKEFLLLVSIGAFLAVPLAWWFMSEWLSNFSYKTPLGISVFVLPILLTLVVALLAMMYHTIMATRINPIDSIKHE
ncbi:MAG: ABC transporter permease [Chryseotalea sp. WA131a]|nr:MAG: ABC transporter permease [Chryseotalea sp. WA131a]